MKPPKVTKPTKRQLLVLDFIAKYIERAGYAPTIREIGDGLDIRSNNGVNDHLKALVRKGLLERDLERSRAMRLVQAPAQGTAPAPIAPAQDLSCTIEALTELAAQQRQQILQLTERLQEQEAIIAALRADQVTPGDTSC
jgi:SOS-response transcriptional repressor LexA